MLFRSLAGTRWSHEEVGVGHLVLRDACGEEVTHPGLCLYALERFRNVCHLAYHLTSARKGERPKVFVPYCASTSERAVCTRRRTTSGVPTASIRRTRGASSSASLT